MAMRPSDVTAIILTTGEATTAEAIEGIRRQSTPVADIVEVRGIRPFHKALNHGASLVKTPYFLQVDSDMLLDTDCVGALRNAMQADVGITVGQLRDAMMGAVVGIKLFRTACFAHRAMPDSISPDTDFVEAIAASGWRTVYVGKQEGEPRTFGEHRPDYQPPYVFRKFMMEGQRYRYRAAPGGLRWQYNQLKRSPHPLALLARVALAAGVFETADGDALGRQGASDGRSVIETLLNAAAPLDGALPSLEGSLRERFDAALAIGAKGDGGIFLRALAVFEELSDDSRLFVLTLGLCRGFVSGGDPKRAYELVEPLFGLASAASESGAPDLPLDEVFEYARREKLRRFVVAPAISQEFAAATESFEAASEVSEWVDGARRPRIRVPFRPMGSIICTDPQRLTGVFWCLDLLRQGYTRAHLPGPFGGHEVSIAGQLVGGLTRRLGLRLPSQTDALSTLSVQRILATRGTRIEQTPALVLMVIESVARGGSERQLVAMAEGLQRRGFRVVVLTLSGSTADTPSYEPYLRQLGIEVRHALAAPAASQHSLTGTVGNLRPADAARLPRWLRSRVAAVTHTVHELRPEVVHAWSDGPGCAALLAASGLGLRHILVQQGSLAIHRRGHPGSALFRDIYRTLVGREGISLINNSRAGAIDNEEWIGLPRGSVGVRYNGLLLDTVRQVEAGETSRYRAALGWTDETPVVGTVTRLVAVKDPELWLETAALVLERRPAVRFLVGGYGPLEAATRARAEILGLGDRIRFVGPVEDVALAYSAMDVVLLSSAIEGVPNVMIEAQAVGRAVVAPDVGGAAEALEEEVTGLIGRPRTAEALAAAVIRLLDDPQWRERIKRDGPRFVAERFDLDAMVEDTIAYYGVTRP